MVAGLPAHWTLRQPQSHRLRAFRRLSIELTAAERAEIARRKALRKAREQWQHDLKTRQVEPHPEYRTKAERKEQRRLDKAARKQIRFNRHLLASKPRTP